MKLFVEIRHFCRKTLPKQLLTKGSLTKSTFDERIFDEINFWRTTYIRDQYITYFIHLVDCIENFCQFLLNLSSKVHSFLVKKSYVIFILVALF